MSEYEQLSFFLIDGLKEGSEFGLDGKVWTVKRFRGVKLIRPGLHLFLCGAGTGTGTGGDGESTSGFGVRHAVVRFFGHEPVTLTAEWRDERIARLEETAVSVEYKQSMDQQLAPCQPHELWHEMTKYVTPETLERVMRLDDKSGCALVDGFTSVATGSDNDDVEGLRLVSFDLKKSAPTNSTGAELSRWTMDKSRLLQSTIERLPDQKELLAELQLAFVLFVLVHNYAALETYESLLSLLCRSHSALMPESGLLPLFVVVVETVTAQLSFLPPDFFSTQLPSLERFLLDSFEALKRGMEDALPAYAADHVVWKAMLDRWTRLADTTVERFGWQLGMFRGSRHRFASTADDGVAIEDLEEGEDAPVIVE